LSRALATVLCLAVLTTTAATPVAAKSQDADVATTPIEGEFVPGEVIVTYKAGVTADASRLQGLTRIQGLAAGSKEADAGPQLLSTGGRPVEQVLGELQADPSVLHAEPNYRVFLADPEVAAVPVDDPKTSDQYSLDSMRVRDAWNRSSGGSNLVAVLDTGVMSAHPDLAGRVVRGYDFVNDDTNAGDDNGHGTWVAGIIASNANDGYGMAGISWTDKILPVKVMNQQGLGNSADLLAGIRWSADHGADVINMSVGGFPYSQAMQDAVNYAFGKGAVLVGAAGNNRRDEVFYPASFDNVISVSATQPEDEFSNWSSYGSHVDVSAPGSSVMVTNCYTCTYGDHDSWGSHMLISGTSFATPNVSGVVALIRAQYPNMTAAQVVDRLYSTVDDLGYAGWEKRYGRGIVNAYRALGGTIAPRPRPAGDGHEGNNAVTQTARRIPLGTTVRPNIYPAGDVDVYTVDVPRAGRLDVRVTGVVDTRAWPWHGSGLPVDPVVDLYHANGTHIKRVDGVWESGTELAQLNVGGWTRVIIRVSNWYPNGNRKAYGITPTFVDNVRPVATATVPAPHAVEVSRFIKPVVTFNEAVSNVSSTTVRLRDMGTDLIVPATLSYDQATRTAVIIPNDKIRAVRPFRVEVTSAVVDAGGNAVTYTPITFMTNSASFADTYGTPFEPSIEWLVGSGITFGCSESHFCPKQEVSREQMAGFLSRALALPASVTNHFTDDNGRTLEDKVNSLADAGVTKGCAAGRFCPTAVVTRWQMASFLDRALDPAPTDQDFFADDAGATYEDAVNRLAAAGIVSGCGATSFCPNGVVTREQMAAFLHRAFGPPD
jgi:serine protease